MTNQIAKSFDSVTIKKIGVEALKIGAVAFLVAVITYLTGQDFGTYNALMIPVLRYTLGVIEQYQKGE